MSPQFTQRPQDEILLTSESGVVAPEQELVARGEGQPIVEIDGEEDRGDVVVAVVAASEHFQTEVELGRGGDLDGRGERVAHAATTGSGAERVRATHSATERVSARRIGSIPVSVSQAAIAAFGSC